MHVPNTCLLFSYLEVCSVFLERRQKLRQGEELVTIDWWEDSGDPHSDQAKVCSDIIFYLPGTLPENGTCYLVNSKGTGKQAIS